MKIARPQIGREIVSQLSGSRTSTARQLAGAGVEVAHQQLRSWSGHETKLHISLLGGSLGWKYLGETYTFTGREKVAHRLSANCTSTTKQLHQMETKLHTKSLSKHTHVRFSFEEHAARVPTVKTDLNSYARFKSYNF